MKNIKYFILIAISVVIFESCTKNLDEYNPSGLTANTVYNNAIGFETLVNAAYSYNRYWYGKEEGFSYSEMGTDIWTSGTGDANPQFTVYNNLQGSNVDGGTGTSTWTSLWTDLYSAVNLCNQGIASVNKVVDYSPTQKAAKEAELRFLRAFYYWHIVETWGGVNFTTTPTEGLVTTANRTPVDTFYNQIITDLNFAVNNLPKTSADYGRATQPVAKAFLSRIYLTRNMNNEAIAVSNDVINNYGYSLVPTYGDLWNMGNLKNKEVIWALDYSSNLSYNDAVYFSNAAGVPQRGSNNAHLFFIMLYDKANTSPLIRDINGGRPFNRFMPTLAYLKMFDQTADSRYKGSFQDTWLANKAATGYALGDTAVYTPNASIATANLSKKYVTYDLSKIYNTTTGAVTQRNYYPSLKKFKDSTRTSIAEVQSVRDVFLIRLGEVYLNAAEAEFNKGNLDSAAYYLNVVRKRAALPGKTTNMTVAASDVTLNFILDERARELGGEQLRWFDLKRTGTLIDRVKALNPDAAVNIQTYHTLRPIPQSQLDAVTNKTKFKQNPGYN
jgi:hypothetical protein